jgi:hypothetical protein
MLGAIATGSIFISSTSTAVSVPREMHAPRIPGPPPAITTGTQRVLEWTSKNWSGYALTGTGFTAVTGTWHVPEVQTPTKKRLLKKSAYSSTWVGIDGFNNRSLIQAGTEQDWVRGRALYQAWWELFPAPETPIPSMTIHPGDAISVSITRGVPNWTISVTDTTSGQSFSSSHAYHGPGASAEWIQEAPTLGRRVATLAVDSLAVFDHGTANGASPGLVSSESGAIFKARRQISTPSAPDTDADGFAVAYGSSAPPAPSS